MRLPGFTADQAASGRRGAFRAAMARHSQTGGVVPALPHCDNCDEILERCANNGGRPRAVCRACAEGRCYSGVEVLPDVPPGFPYDWFNRPPWR